MNDKPSNTLKIANYWLKLISSGNKYPNDFLVSVFLKWGENFTFEGMQVLAKLKNLKNLEIDFDYIVFDIAFIESDVIIKLISDCLSLRNMKFYQKRPIKELSHYLKEYALKNQTLSSKVVSL